MINIINLCLNAIDRIIILRYDVMNKKSTFENERGIMIIHLYESVVFNPPPKDTEIIVNCGEEIPAGDSITASWDDGRMCAKCLTIHNSRPCIPRLATFALVELKDVDLAETSIHWCS